MGNLSFVYFAEKFVLSTSLWIMFDFALKWKSLLLIAGLEIQPKTSGDLFELFVFFNLYMTSENTWHLCTNHGWFWIQFTVNCAFEIMIKILCHWTVTKRPMNLRMNLLHTCDVMYNLYTSQLLSRLDTVPWSIFQIVSSTPFDPLDFGFIPKK